MTNPASRGENNINVLLLLRDHLPNAIRSVKSNITRMEAALVEARAELEVLVRHAAVAQIVVEDTVAQPPTPDAAP